MYIRLSDFWGVRQPLGILECILCGHVWLWLPLFISGVPVYSELNMRPSITSSVPHLEAILAHINWSVGGTHPK